MIFWGPPGCGKTTLAFLLAQRMGAKFIPLSAVSSGTGDIKKIIEETVITQEKTILFIDEVHRYSKLQQNIFLPYVENGTIIFIGATTENPSFEIIAPLLSRCRVLVLERLSRDDLHTILNNGLKELKVKIT